MLPSASFSVCYSPEWIEKNWRNQLLTSLITLSITNLVTTLTMLCEDLRENTSEDLISYTKNATDLVSKMRFAFIS